MVVLFLSTEKIIYTRISNQLSLTQDYYTYRTNTRVTRELVSYEGGEGELFETFEQYILQNAQYFRLKTRYK